MTRRSVSPAVAAALLYSGVRLTHLEVRRARPAAVIRTGQVAPIDPSRVTTTPLIGFDAAAVAASRRAELASAEFDADTPTIARKAVR